MQNKLILADNLSALKELETETIDLIYIDPPFNSNRNYIGKITDGSGKEILAKFEDTWRGGMKTYIHEFMYPIVKELHRVLKKTGSFYLHCDPTAQAYLQVEVLDPIFGISNFRNEIVWYYKRWTATSSNFQRMHDIIFLYSKAKDFIFNKLLQDYSKPELIEDTVRGFVDGKLVRLKNADGSYIKREKKNEGVLMHDVWTDINFLGPTAKERSGYPTQKPEKLLERIILASSNEGDTVLDCFLGSGTTIVVADRLKRNWVGIDHNPVSISVTKSRLNNNISLFNQIAGRNYTYKAKKYNYDELRKMDDFEFEKLMVNKLGGRLSKEGKGADKGIDGIFNERGIISVKRWGKKVDRNTLDNLISAIRRYRRDKHINPCPKDIPLEGEQESDNLQSPPCKGVGGLKAGGLNTELPLTRGLGGNNTYIKIQKGEINLSEYDGIIAAFGFTKDTHAEVVDLKTKDNFNILLLTVEEILPVAKPPIVKIEGNANPRSMSDPLKEVQESDNLQSLPFKGAGGFKAGFIAKTTTEEKIENYAWTIIRLDLKNGEEKQIFKTSLINTENVYTENLPAGSFKIICEVTDENGLSGSDELELVISSLSN